MSDDLQTLRHQIEGAQKVESIVKTMKTLAASQINVYEEALQSLELYKYTVDLGMMAAVRERYKNQRRVRETYPLQKNKQITIAFGTDQGLVGQFNERMAGHLDLRSDYLFLVGERLVSYLPDYKNNLRQFSLPLTLAETSSFVEKVLNECELVFENDDSYKVNLLYHKPTPSQSYELQNLRILPLDENWEDSYLNRLWPTKNLPQVIGEHTWSFLRREFIFITLYSACISSLASENLARLLSMQRAQKNIEELLVDLQLGHNRLRQSVIDSELFDVIAGFKALHKVD